ncbi:carbohydrate ABC transporter permease [Clostridium chromiireducens]|uniref:ABC transporter permease subunit n=1 Tax=Clostridium chromiireducens TaxID=225345 RepID=A0A1V4ILX9_9CLOT|nr:carbohydrate ABC transporter permease [Clostridium chromiireducens]MVX62455.1 ABC transporter permease subunit [Clostridium chromiireducens]OPJ61032.1 L-arabinose transport system permease protein AraQ [Clostridium chromiireducens]RII36275.1 carbohydrate ABC transporter permease [Clostridium chromiireducens]
MKNKKLIANIIKYIVISGLLLLYIVPFVFVLINSFKARKDVISNPLALPSTFKFSNYADAFEKMNYGHAFINTLIITALSVLIIIIFSSMTAYILVRKDWKFNKFIFFAMVLSMIIPFQGIMIPLVSIYGSMGMLNTKWALIYMYLGFGMSLAVFMYHGFIKSIPVELEEAAMIDGATRFQTFWQIVFPIMKPITMTITTLDVLWIWNDFLLPSLILIAPNERTLQLSTYAFNGTYTTDYGLSMSALMLSILPVLIIYLFLQKSIIGGVLQGSIK